MTTDVQILCLAAVGVVAAGCLWRMSLRRAERRITRDLEARLAAWKADPQGQLALSRAHRPSAPETPTAAALVVQLGTVAPCQAVLLACGDRPFEAHQQVVLLALQEPGAPRVLWEGLLHLAEIALLAEHNFGVPCFQGEAAGFFSDKQWRFAFTSAPHPFRLYDRKGLRASVDQAGLQLMPARGPARRVSALEIGHVAAELSDDWMRRGVAVVLATGERVPVLLRTEWAVALYMFYDGLELDSDTGWVHDLARALGTALNVPVVSSPHFA